MPSSADDIRRYVRARGIAPQSAAAAIAALLTSTDAAERRRGEAMLRQGEALLVAVATAAGLLHCTRCRAPLQTDGDFARTRCEACHSVPYVN